MVAGLFLEGETVMIASAFAAHRGYLNIYLIVPIGFLATLSSDWFYFFLGRRGGRKAVEKRPSLSRHVQQVTKLMDKYPVLILVGYRFLYGFRIVVPVAVGLSRIKAKKFILFSTGATLLWTLAFSAAGYFFGAFLERRIKELGRFEWPIILGIVAFGILSYLFYKYVIDRKKDLNQV
jgi:membrane protein DedA with SNARE-associated domain